MRNDGAAVKAIELCPAGAIAPGRIARATLPDGGAVAIYNVDGAYFVSDDMCTHAESSLSEEGTLDGYLVECAWHYGKFDVRDGAVAAAPCAEALRTYPVTVVDGTICVTIA
jgi:p-cumate 2,3-dioxygenase ferredoxin subunit